MKKISLIDIILFVLSFVLFLGTIFVFHACPAKDDGSWMVCHWAEHGVIALSAPLAFLSLIRLFIKNGLIKTGISLSFVPIAVLTAFIPGVFINLCMMKDMRCHTIMRPSVIVLCILIAALSLVDVLVQQKNAKKAQ